MPYYTYILYSIGHDQYYIGQTRDVTESVKHHNRGGDPTTAPYSPWQLVWFVEKDSKNEAAMMERKLKKLPKKRIEDFIAKHA